jgi:hypothetical protein
MQDIDIIVRRDDASRLRGVLRREGWTIDGDPARPFTIDRLEWCAYPPPSCPRTLVEIHLGLDKVVLREALIGDMFARATTAPGRTSLMVPSLEDHLLLVVLHLAADDYQHDQGFEDLGALLAAGADVARVATLARAWRATTATYLAFSHLEETHGIALPPGVAALRPGLLRTRLLRRAFDLDRRSSSRAKPKLGLAWIGRQTLLRDDLAAWSAGLLSYAALRAVERGRAAWAR